MPKDGFKSITVSDEVYNKFLKQYQAKSDELKEKGIFSLSGYITMALHEHKGNQQLDDVVEMSMVTNSILLALLENMLSFDKETAMSNLMNMKMHMLQFTKKKQKECST